MTTEDKLIQIAENTHKVYEKGYVDGDNDGYFNGYVDGANIGEIEAREKFAKMFTADGKRTKYTRAFNETDFTGFTFDPPIKPTVASDYMFYNYSIGTELPKGIDLSAVPKGTSTITTTSFCLYSWCSKITEIYDMKLPVQFSYSSTFSYCRKLITIEKIRTDKAMTYPNAFQNCDSLENVTFEGEIGQDISFINSPNLSNKTLKNIVNHLYDYSTEAPGTKNLTLHADAKDRLEAITELHESGSTYIDRISDLGWNLV